MIKLIIFDLDGVLVDAREIHYKALNKALRSIDPKYVIGREEHLSTYDGLPTRKKLRMLTTQRDLPLEEYDCVWERKQKATLSAIDEMIPDRKNRSILRQLKREGYQIGVATNSIRLTTKMMLLRTGLLEYIDFVYSNQDVVNPKPHPEMYLHLMIKAEVSPKETLIIEDSHYGRKAALESGAFLLPVKDVEDLTYDKIRRELDLIAAREIIRPRWQGGKMNILIPMAGAGKRFAQAGYTFPKPLVDVNGKPMIQTVVENLNIEANYIFIVLDEHCKDYNIHHLLHLLIPDCTIVRQHGLVEGAVCSTLLAEAFISNDDPLLIANSDQFIEWESNEFLYAVSNECDGGILTFNATHPKWSFVKLNEGGFVSEVAEKKPISDLATVGVYYWQKGSDYIKYAKQMMDKDIRTKGEFYVCPVYNEAIQDGKKIRSFKVDKMWGLGTPEDLNSYLEHHK